MHGSNFAATIDQFIFPASDTAIGQSLAASLIAALSIFAFDNLPKLAIHVFYDKEIFDKSIRANFDFSGISFSIN
jgi:hypothetical protein